MSAVPASGRISKSEPALSAILAVRFAYRRVNVDATSGFTLNFGKKFMPSSLIPLFDAVDKSQRAPAAVRVAFDHPHFLETAWKSVPCRFWGTRTLLQSSLP